MNETPMRARTLTAEINDAGNVLNEVEERLMDIGVALGLIHMGPNTLEGIPAKEPEDQLPDLIDHVEGIKERALKCVKALDSIKEFIG